MKTYVIVGPKGLAYIGLHENETSAWCTALGWPNDEEIAARKYDGWYCAEAEVTWRKP